MNGREGDESCMREKRTKGLIQESDADGFHRGQCYVAVTSHLTNVSGITAYSSFLVMVDHRVRRSYSEKIRRSFRWRTWSTIPTKCRVTSVTSNNATVNFMTNILHQSILMLGESYFSTNSVINSISFTLI